MKAGKIPRTPRSKWLVAVVEPGHGAIDVLYLGRQWPVARTKIDAALSSRQYRGKILRTTKTENGVVVWTRDRPVK